MTSNSNNHIDCVLRFAGAGGQQKDGLAWGVRGRDKPPLLGSLALGIQPPCCRETHAAREAPRRGTGAPARRQPCNCTVTARLTSHGAEMAKSCPIPYWGVKNDCYFERKKEMSPWKLRRLILMFISQMRKLYLRKITHLRSYLVDGAKILTQVYMQAHQ